MQELRQSTQVLAVIGPVVAVANGYVPVTTLDLSTADEAELLKHNTSTVTSISAATFAAITSADGYYVLTLTTSHTDTLGMVTVAINDDSLCLPVKQTFMVLSAQEWDRKYTTTGYMQMGLVATGTAQSATATTLVLAAAEAFADDTVNGMTLVVYGSTQGYAQVRQVTDYVLSTDTATVDTWTVTPSGTITYWLFATPPAVASGTLPSVTVGSGGITTASFAAGAINAAAIAADAITDAKVASDVTIASVTGAVGSVTGAVGSVTAGVTLANGAHGGAAATLTLQKAVISNSTAGEPAVAITASGTGNAHGLAITASGGGKGLAIGAASVGVSIDSTTADAVQIQGGTDSDGLQVTGNGTGVDIRADITGNLTGNVSGSVGSVTAIAANAITAAATAADFGTEIAAAVLAAAAADPIDANIEQINTVAITGNGGAQPFNV
jgi:hypothetical protein